MATVTASEVTSPYCVVLTSGGIDSMAVLHIARKHYTTIVPLWVDYGQQAAARERAAALRVTSGLNLRLHEARLEASEINLQSGEMPGRNAFLVATAVLLLRQRPATVALGIHAGTAYYDCSPQFVRHTQAWLDGYASGTIQLWCPFLDWRKTQIIDYCKSGALAVEDTYSCEVGSDPTCGTCASCIERLAFLQGDAE